MAGATKTKSKFLIVFSLLVAAIIAGAVLLRRIPATARLFAIWETTYFHLGNVAVSPELVFETFVFLLLLAFFTRYARRFLRNEVLIHTAWTKGNVMPSSARPVTPYLHWGCLWACRWSGSI